MVHISLNPHPDDVLTDAQLTAIAREYMEKMGFGDMPYMVYKHTDINRHHMHIVALRVRPDGSCVTDKNNFYRSKEITREIEREYGLKTAEREKVTPDTPLLKVNPSGDLKKQVASVVKIVGMRYRFQTIGEYNAVLGLFNVKCEQTDGRVNGREYHGLVYFALGDDGKPIASPFKSSRLGKFARREAIDTKYVHTKEKIDMAPTKKVVEDVMSHSSDKDDFISRLKEKNIDVVFRYTGEGRIYGATFIDHNTMTVLNGSRMGKEFSANAFENWLNGNGQKPNVPVEILSDNQSQPQSDPVGNNADGHNESQQHRDETGNTYQSESESNVSNRSQSESDDYEIEMSGLDLFQTSPSVNPDEENFQRRVKREVKRAMRRKR